MTVKPFLIITLLCSSSLLNTHPAHAQGIVTYDNAPIPSDGSQNNSGSGDVTRADGSTAGSISPNGTVTRIDGSTAGSINPNGTVTRIDGSTAGSISPNGDLTDASGSSAGHAPNRTLGALILLHVLPLQ
ncbi:hypothetical protein [Saccharibacter floricola]|uniref:hypothetical protein n=1 Tax=Saccharibacter floricola TaxID=231053 RepID=UPI00222F6CC9|nr:hypothetical protein [Saccharibacter floricola]